MTSVVASRWFGSLLPDDRPDRLTAPLGQFRDVHDLPIVLNNRARDLSIKLGARALQAFLGTSVGAKLRNQIPLSHMTMLAHNPHDNQPSREMRQMAWRKMVTNELRAERSDTTSAARSLEVGLA